MTNKLIGDTTDAGPSQAKAPPLPSSECSDRCVLTFKDCNLACDGDASAKCADACNKPYKSCMRTCFK